MKQTDWKILYTSYEGVAKRAIQLLSREVGRYLIREEGVYRIHVLPCEREGSPVSKNAFFIGLYGESEVIRRHLTPAEVPEGGFAVKVMKNPADPEGSLVLLTAHDPCELFSAVVHFLDHYIPERAPQHGSNYMPELIFDSPLVKYFYSEVPDHRTRSIFTWGHSINDYRAYIDNMARLGFNELVLWNDYVPLNIDEIIDYAHSFGIRVILGYSWGWKEIGSSTDSITEDKIAAVKELAIREYREHYAPTRCDGIYFQSFTERQESVVGGKVIARLVTDMVNEIAAELFRETPDLRLIFGLHASSVRDRLDEIARVDPRVDILWEDCGEFPYHYHSHVRSEEQFEETCAFTKELLALRGGRGVGLVFKGVMMLDWSRFINQRGPYVMGQNPHAIAEHDRRVRAGAWRLYSAAWMKNGGYAHRLMRFIAENKLGEVNMCAAGTFDGGMYLPFALTAAMFRHLDPTFEATLHRISRLPHVTLE